MIVEKIYGVIRKTEAHLNKLHPEIGISLPEKITFINTEQLQQQYPDLTPREREDRICRKHNAVFIQGIGAELADGKPHDGRAPDYDDWTTTTPAGVGVNGDIFVWNPILNRAFELSSMGIRVDAESLQRQLAITGDEDRATLPYHKRLLAGELPQSIGGGIGQSRLCMFFLRKAHVGEVQCSVWPDDMQEKLMAEGITLL